MNRNKQLLNLHTLLACDDVCNDVRTKSKGRRIKKWDYPGAVVSCAVGINPQKCSTDTSGVAYADSYIMVPELEIALKKIGDIGKRSPLCNNYIGACAEPRAARKCIRNNQGTTIADLWFSAAYRPRTKEILPYCPNCKTVFCL